LQINKAVPPAGAKCNQPARGPWIVGIATGVLALQLMSLFLFVSVAVATAAVSLHSISRGRVKSGAAAVLC
jgi:hypothetical protein